MGTGKQEIWRSFKPTERDEKEMRKAVIYGDFIHRELL